MHMKTKRLIVSILSTLFFGLTLSSCFGNGSGIITSSQQSSPLNCQSEKKSIDINQKRGLSETGCPVRRISYPKHFGKALSVCPAGLVRSVRTCLEEGVNITNINTENPASTSVDEDEDYTIHQFD